MADITSGCTVIATETLQKGKLVVFTTAATADDQDYIVFDNATLSSTLTNERLVPKFAIGLSGYANVFTGLTTDTTVDAMAWDATVVTIKGAFDNLARTIAVYAVSASSTGGD